MITPLEFAVKLRERAEQIRMDNRPLALAAQSTHAMMYKRIFSNGLDVNGNGIGMYSEKDIWVNPEKTATKNQRGFNPLRGKSGRTKFISNPERQRKTSYFKGWRGLRLKQRLDVDIVNLTFTGDLFFDFSRPVQFVNVNEYVSTFSSKISTDKAKGNEEHFNTTIFKLSNEEKTEFRTVIEKELKLMLSK